MTSLEAPRRLNCSTLLMFALQGLAVTNRSCRLGETGSVKPVWSLRHSVRYAALVPLSKRLIYILPNAPAEICSTGTLLSGSVPGILPHMASFAKPWLP